MFLYANKQIITSAFFTSRIALSQRARVPRSFTFVAESGIEAPEHLRQLRDAGVDAALVGTLFMGAEDPGAALASVLDAIG